jgi:hypothetical protein
MGIEKVFGRGIGKTKLNRDTAARKVPWRGNRAEAELELGTKSITCSLLNHDLPCSSKQIHK